MDESKSVAKSTINKRVAVLLVNTGSPDSTDLSDIRRYLRQFLMDKRVLDMSVLKRWLLVNLIIVPNRAKKSQVRYRRVWNENGSPLITYGKKVSKTLSENLEEPYIVEFAARYGEPSIKTILSQLKSKCITDLIILPLFPQYASATVGSILEDITRRIAVWPEIPWITAINSFFDDPLFISAWVKKGKPYLESGPNHILFSFHGIPESQIISAAPNESQCLKSPDCCQTNPRPGCYRAQCYQTARLIAEGLGIPDHQYSVSFQSRLGKTKWTSPYTNETMIHLAETGVKKLLVFCPSFVADCLETLDEIGFEERSRFIDSGGDELILVPSLNCDPDWITCLKSLIIR